ncbi:MAG TPA: TauD/TfdA family dioxygenase [Pyrinomonadaceae bacterium]|nr:TauD/TfdA family dioxygenase [Pyrinomonadaceae bacterium]
MADTNIAETSLKRPGAMKRKAIGISQASLIKTERLKANGLLPLLVQPAVRGVNLCQWASNNRGFIGKNLLESGGILFRNFNIKDAAEFEEFAAAASGCELLEYKERSSPRSQVGGKVYTSTDYPADQSIFVHNENSYQRVWPLNIFFYCAQSAPQGGETPIADTRRILARIPLEIQRRFNEKRWMYVRNFSERFGLPWQTVFQTTDRAVVETYCRLNQIEVEWRDDDQLTTRAVRPAMTRHPRTGEDIWFNHATFFHVTTLDPTVRDVFLTAFKQEELPTNTYYGDGSPIEPDVLDELRAIYQAETVSFPWQDGDILMLDNMLAAHGRAPYSGPRRILVAMTEPASREEIFKERSVPPA